MKVLSLFSVSSIFCAALVSVSGVATAQIEANQFFETDTFNYPAGDLVGQGPWVVRGTNTTPPVTVVSGSLTYAGGGIPASAGNAVKVESVTGQDARFLFTPIVPADGNVYYYSMVIMWDGSSLTAGSSYLAAFLASNSSTTTFFRGLLRATEDAGTVKLGTQLAASAQCEIAYAPTALVANEPVFVVVKVTEVAGVENDLSELFLFTAGAVPATEPAATVSVSHVVTPSSSLDIATTNSGAGLQGVALRQFQTYPGNWVIDDLRGGSTWTSVITGTTGVSDWSVID